MKKLLIYFSCIVALFIVFTACPGDQSRSKCGEGYEICVGCQGSGIQKCLICNGTGKDFAFQHNPCGMCNGKGENKCVTCYGGGCMIGRPNF